jgi:hypothetical protein
MNVLVVLVFRVEECKRNRKKTLGATQNSVFTCLFLLDSSLGLHLCPEDGGSTFQRIIGELLPDYTVMNTGKYVFKIRQGAGIPQSL